MVLLSDVWSLLAIKCSFFDLFVTTFKVKKKKNILDFLVFEFGSVLLVGQRGTEHYTDNKLTELLTLAIFFIYHTSK